MKTISVDYQSRPSRIDTTAARVFLAETSVKREFMLECVDGSVIMVHSPTATEDSRVNVVVSEVEGASPGLADLQGCILSFAYGARLTASQPVSCVAVLANGGRGILRMPGVRYAG